MWRGIAGAVAPESNFLTEGLFALSPREPGHAEGRFGGKASLVKLINRS